MHFTSTRFVVTPLLSVLILGASKAFDGEDSYSFVAIIDIVLTDGAKRTCTGTIIHDNVVITTAHCFVQEKNKYTQPELTASFVVIGTKKMFDTSYEQYLPIERVLIHPDYKGWSDDLALVFTFASMVSDKPGRIIPLASDTLMTPVDGNVTVISWGRCKDDVILYKQPKHIYDGSWSNEEILTTTEHVKLRKRFKVTSRGKHRDEYDSDKINRCCSEYRFSNIDTLPTEFDKTDGIKRQTPLYYSYERLRAYRTASNDPVDSENEYYSQWETTADKFENSENNLDILYGHLNNRTNVDSGENRRTWKKRKVALDKFQSKLNIRKLRSSYLPTTYNVMPHYKNNWRRKMGKQQNKLTVEVFGFINVASCRKIVEKAKPALYQIQNGNEIICYASEDHFVTAEDSGAPAISHGYLVAVTVGGAEFDGDQVAIGMKISCYCSWIAENLPDGGPLMQCCINCCEMPLSRNSEEESEEKHRHARKRKKKKLSQ